MDMEGPSVLKQGPLFIPLVGEYIPSHLFMALEPSALANPPPSLPTQMQHFCWAVRSPDREGDSYPHTVVHFFGAHSMTLLLSPLFLLRILHTFSSPRWLGRPYPAHILSAKGGGRGGDGEKWRVVGSSSSFPSPAIQPRYRVTGNECDF